MLFPWKRSARKGRQPPESRKKESKLKALQAEGRGALIRFQNVSLSPVIHNLSTDIKQGDWVLLQGPDDFAKALFCDLCFGYIQAESGSVFPALKGGDVSYLGRPNTTYGKTLIEHLSCGTRDCPRELMEAVVNAVFSPSLRKLTGPESPLVLKNGKRIHELELNEKDFLEIAEANVLLQRRHSVIIDTGSDFYRLALELGFQHSTLLLESGKTIFWLIDEKVSPQTTVLPWRKYPNTPKISFYFSPESRSNHIN